MRLKLKFAYIFITLFVFLCSACSGANIIGSKDAQIVEDSVKEEYMRQVSSRTIEANSYAISQYKVLGEGSTSSKDMKIYCITVLPEDSLQWVPFVVVKYGETTQATYPYEEEWIGNGCDDFVTDELAFLGSISAQDKQRLEEAVSNYHAELSYGTPKNIDKIEILGKSSVPTLVEDIDLYCVVIHLEGKTQWNPFQLYKIGEYWDVYYPTELEWNSNGCGGLVDYELDYYNYDHRYD